MRLIRSITVFLLLLPGLFCAGRGGQRLFTHIDINEGLSHNTVLSIVEDGSGFLWFATPDGLNRYDGYDFTVFRHSDTDPSSIANNSINTLFLDSSGRLWVGTSVGLSLWNSTGERFENFDAGFPLAVTAIGEISPTLFFVATGRGLYVFNDGEKSFVRDLPEAAQGLMVNVIAGDGDRIWLGSTSQGLFCYSVSDGEIKKHLPFNQSVSIQSIFPDDEGSLWVGTEGKGLFRIDLNTSETVNFRHSEGGDGLCSDFVRALDADIYGNLWVGTVNGLSVLDRESGKFTAYSSDVFEEGSLSHKSVKCIYRDSQGGMWLGTFFGGINYQHDFRERFSVLRRKVGGNSLNDNIISCMVEDDGGEIWIGTNSGGVNRYNPSKGTFSSYRIHSVNTDAVESNDVKTIFVDGNSVYVGAHGGGLSLIDRRTGRVAQCGRGHNPSDVYSIERRDGGSFWIGALTGLYSYNIYEDKFTYEASVSEHFFKIYCLFRDSSDRLWIGAERGLNAYSCATGVLTGLDIDFPEQLTRAYISDFYEDGSGNIWIGSHRGLWCYCPEDGGFRHFSVEDGLPNDCVQGIVEDMFGRLWLGTNNGLCCFNPYSDTFRNYTVEDGLQSNEFNACSRLKTSSGEMYFGGVNGITVFNPEGIVDNPYSPTPIITRLSVSDHVVRPDDNTGILDESIVGAERIRIKPSQNSFSIDFSVCNYLAGRHNSFAYMLEGLDSDWITASSLRTVTYAFLPAGKYRFLVRAANNDGKWCETPASLEIEILPVWYRTFWAAIMFTILFCLLIAGGIAFYLDRKSMETRLRIEQKDRENIEEMHQMKMRFFINISHELRSPLTMIMTPLQEIISHCSDIKLLKQLKNMQLNTRRLLHLVDQQMDYRRAELGVFHLSVKRETITPIILENCRYYEELARTKGLKYYVPAADSGLKALVDACYLELILNNLLSNAFRYTDEGSVTVAVSLDGSELVLEVRDTGVGIPQSRQTKIFERFYQIDENSIGSGIGLSLVQRLVELHHGRIEIDSEENKGSCFRVFFPQDISVYSADELVGEGEEVAQNGEFAAETFDNAEEELVPEIADDGTKPVVLVVEDDAQMRKFIYEGLKNDFYVLASANGEQALEVVGATPPDVIVTDLMMPVMDGIAFCSKIKRDSKTAHICVIILSGKVDEQTQVECFKAGADDFIFKPFSTEILVRKINNTLRTRQRVVEKYSGFDVPATDSMGLNMAEAELLKRATEIVERNMDNSSFSVDDFASEMNMSKSNLHSKLRAVSGDAPLDFIRRIRFREACELMKQGKYSVSEISYRVGFSTPSYFTVSFKRHFGVLPTEYMKRQDNYSVH